MRKIFMFNNRIFPGLKTTNSYSVVNTIDEADTVLIIHKIRSKQTGIKFINEHNYQLISDAYSFAKSNNKQLIIYCGGDRPPVILPDYDNVMVLNQSVVKSNKPTNEYVIGVPVEDKFTDFILEPELTIGFVGQKCRGREKYLNYLENQPELKTNFVLRDSYIHKLKSSHINEFNNNMNNNLFTFCYRGAGNYSVRFYETIMRGRIPIVIKTDNVFPYEKLIEYDKMGIFIEESDLISQSHSGEHNKEDDCLKELILTYYNEKTKDELINIQKYNRHVYLTYFHGNSFWEQMLNKEARL